MNYEDYTPPEPITDSHGLLVDRWLGAHIAEGILDQGNIYLCHTVPEFQEAWQGMDDAGTMEAYLMLRKPPGWAQHGANVIRAGLVLFGDRTIVDDRRRIEARVSALHQSIRDVIDALNRGELTVDIIWETIEERLS